MAVCGDGFLWAGVETCDDGGTADGDYCASGCDEVTGACGDGVVQGNESCDDGNTVSNDYCLFNCQLVTGSCGDGVIQKTLEVCDDGNSSNVDATSLAVSNSLNPSSGFAIM